MCGFSVHIKSYQYNQSKKSNNARIFPARIISIHSICSFFLLLSAAFKNHILAIQIAWICLSRAHTQFGHQCQWCLREICIFSETFRHSIVEKKTAIHWNWVFNNKIIEVYGQCFLIDFLVYFFTRLKRFQQTNWFDSIWWKATDSNMVFCIETQFVCAVHINLIWHMFPPVCSILHWPIHFEFHHMHRYVFLPLESRKNVHNTSERWNRRWKFMSTWKIYKYFDIYSKLFFIHFPLRNLFSSMLFWHLVLIRWVIAECATNPFLYSNWHRNTFNDMNVKENMMNSIFVWKWMLNYFRMCSCFSIE